MGETVQSLVADAGGPSSLLNIVMFMVPMLAIMYFLMIRPEQKKRAEAQALLTALKKGDEVVLTSGVIGKILSVEDKLIVLEVADKVKLRVLKQAVMGPAQRWLAPAPDGKEPKKLEDKKPEDAKDAKIEEAADKADKKSA